MGCYYAAEVAGAEAIMTFRFYTVGPHFTDRC
jgi:hypothetical protein